MPCATAVGAASPPAFGIPAEELSLKTESVRVRLSSDMQELRDSCGNVTNAAFYNRQNEVNIVGYGPVNASYDDVGLSYTLLNAASFAGTLLVGTLYVTEISVELANQGFVKTSVSLKSWESAHV